MMADYKTCIKGTQCQTCKEKKNHNATCKSKQKSDTCVVQKENCQCVNKQYYTRYSEKKGKYEDCEELPLKLSSDNIVLTFWFKI